jgi:hypothetical protein
VHYRQYLPVHDEVMVFVDEMNNEFDTLFRCHKPYGQSLNRWKQFAVAHKLADGDCLVFQLIERLKFKVRFNLFSAHDFRWVFQVSE